MDCEGEGEWLTYSIYQVQTVPILSWMFVKRILAKYIHFNFLHLQFWTKLLFFKVRTALLIKWVSQWLYMMGTETACDGHKLHKMGTMKTCCSVRIHRQLQFTNKTQNKINCSLFTRFGWLLGCFSDHFLKVKDHQGTIGNIMPTNSIEEALTLHESENE